MINLYDKVICINDNFEQTTSKRHTELPVKDKIYTVRSIWKEKNPDRIGINLDGIEGILNIPRKHEQGFDINRFQKINK